MEKERSKYCLSVLNELKKHGVKVLVALKRVTEEWTLYYPQRLFCLEQLDLMFEDSFLPCIVLVQILGFMFTTVAVF